MTELSRRLGLGKSTTHRLVATLEAERLLEQDPATGQVPARAGALRARHHGHRARRPAPGRRCPVLTTLRHRTGEMVHVAVLDGLEAVYVERLESPYMLPVFRRVGHRLPAHWTSSGKVLLAALPRPELERRLKGAELDARTSHTITDHRALRPRARAGRRSGAGPRTSRRASSGSARSARPLRGADGRVIAAVTVVGSSERITEAPSGATGPRSSRPPRSSAAGSATGAASAEDRGRGRRAAPAEPEVRRVSCGTCPLDQRDVSRCRVAAGVEVEDAAVQHVGLGVEQHGHGPGDLVGRSGAGPARCWRRTTPTAPRR